MSKHFKKTTKNQTVDVTTSPVQLLGEFQIDRAAILLPNIKENMNFNLDDAET